MIPTGKYQFESNSQPPGATTARSSCCDSYRKVPIWRQFTTKSKEEKEAEALWFLQESTNLKAIHNDWIRGRSPSGAVIPTGKYQFESNSQLLVGSIWFWYSCDSYRKVPIWKQFTTLRFSLPLLILLWFLQESTNLKAIHNFPMWQIT